MILTHDIQRTEFRRPNGAAACGSALFLRLVTHGAGREASCSLYLWPDGGEARLIPMTRKGSGNEAEFTVTVPLPETPGLLFYQFLLVTPLGEITVAPDERGRPRSSGENAPGWQVTVYLPSPVPQWYKDAVAYQIYPDRFHRGKDYLLCWENAQKAREGFRGPKRKLEKNWNTVPYYERNPDGSIATWNFWGGTLEGIREKLDYLRDLGITMLYINPIFSAASNHRYDTADYFAIDPGLGDEEGLCALIEAAKARGIAIMLDGVFNHTGADSIYFDAYGNYGTGAVSLGKDSPYYSWFRFRHFPDDYEAWWGVKDLPAVHELDPGFLELICGENGVIRYWIRRGVKGWRLDVADELPDDFIKAIRAAARAEDPEAVIIGEVWEDASNKISYGQRRAYFYGEELDGVMNYPLRSMVLDFFLHRTDAYDFKAALDLLKIHYPPENFAGCLNLLGSHDRERLLTLLGGAEPLPEEERRDFRLSPEARSLGLRRERLAALLQFSLPGVPCIYYGDEAEMEGYSDPYNRGPFPWGRESRDLAALYRSLAQLRKNHPVLREGSLRVSAPTPDTLAVVRSLGQESMVLLLNRSETESAFIRVPAKRPAVALMEGGAPGELPLQRGASGGELLRLGERVLSPIDRRIPLRLMPLGAALLWFGKA